MTGAGDPRGFRGHQGSEHRVHEGLVERGVELRDLLDRGKGDLVLAGVFLQLLQILDPPFRQDDVVVGRAVRAAVSSTCMP